MNQIENPPSQAISVAIINTAAMTADLLRQAFANQPGFRVLDGTRSAEDMLRAFKSTPPDVAILGSTERDGVFTAVPLLEELGRVSPTVRSIVVSPTISANEVVAYFRARARGVLSTTDTDFTMLCKCVECVHCGQVWANSEQLVSLIESLSRPQSLSILNASGEPILSAREQQVLHLLAEGHSNRELAGSLGLSEHTIKNHLFRIFDKLGVSSRMEAVLYAMSQRDPSRGRGRLAYTTESKSRSRGSGGNRSNCA